MFTVCFLSLEPLVNQYLTPLNRFCFWPEKDIGSNPGLTHLCSAGSLTKYAGSHRNYVHTYFKFSFQIW